MRSVSFKSVLRGIAARVGDRLEEILDDDAIIWFEYIDDRLRQSWEEFMFPEFVITEKRYYREGFWSAGTYNAGAIVFYEPENRYYLNDSGAATVDEPTLGVAWVEIDEFSRYIPWEQPGKTKIDRPRACYDEDPTLPESVNTGELLFREINQGVMPLNPNAQGFVFLRYRQRVLQITGMEIYDIDAIYNADDVIYFDPDIYVANQTTIAGDDPVTEPTKFDKFEFPYVLKPFVVRAVFSDYLLAEDEESRSNRELQRAISYLEDEIGKIAIQSGQVKPYAGRTI